MSALMTSDCNQDATRAHGVGCSAWLGAFVEVRAVLWNRMCLSQPARNKVTKHNTLDAAIAFVNAIESGLKKEVINGELTFWDAYDMLASICVRVSHNAQAQRTGAEGDAP